MLDRHYSDAPEVNFDSMPEIAGYTTEPPAMYVGAPGKRGYLNLVFELNSEGRSILRELDRRAPLIVQKELYFDRQMPDMPCIYILSSGGPNVDGDRFSQNFRLGKGAMAFVSTGAATKIAEMRYNYSGMKQKLELGEDSYLEYLPEPIIPCRHSRYISDTEIIAHPTASLVYGEVYMPGRKYYRDGEIFAYDVLSIRVHGKRPDNTPLFHEKFVIMPGRDNIRAIGVMADYDIFGNVVVLTPEAHADAIYGQVEPFIDPDQKLACGISHLPHGAGLIFKVLGMEPGPVKKLIRNFCSITRQEVKGRPLPPEFPWR